MNMKKGKLVISIDYEMLWGLTDSNISASRYIELKQVPEVVTHLLNLFKKYEIHATWASVGALTYNNLDEMKKEMTNICRNLLLNQRSNYYLLCEKKLNGNEQTLFDPESFSKIEQTPFQQIECHSFLHIFSDFTSVELFKTDTCLHINRLKKLGFKTPEFYVFPRNQSTLPFLNILKKFGFNSFRGYDSVLYSDEKIFKRILRRIDSIFPLVERNSKIIYREDCELFEFKGSRFLRTFKNTNSLSAKLHYAKLRLGLKKSIQQGKMYHLWFHPHNFTINQANLLLFEDFLKSIQEYVKIDKLVSLNTNEALTSFKINSK
ncbi:MAG TPA: hypothetical protein DCR40_19150 [Prolixibacteraceae bacterium]|nr:hypothetical protein [Prolixibacteraceae bacterium]